MSNNTQHRYHEFCDHSTVMSHVYSTEAFSGDKRRRWQEIIGAVYIPLEIDISTEANFRGEIRHTKFADLELSEFSSDGEFAHRTRRHIKHEGEEFFFFVLARSGALTYAQYDRECTLQLNEFTLIHSNAPYSFTHRRLASGLCLKIPARMLRSRIVDAHGLCGVGRPISAGLGQVFAGVLTSLAAGTANISPTTYVRLENNVVDLLGLLLESDNISGEESPARWAIRQRSIAVMKSRYSDPTLDPIAIARITGVSLRYLHKTFEGSLTTVSESLLNLRLDRSREDLVNPQRGRLSIKQVAFRNGFSSQSYFSSAFRRKFGMSPSDARRSNSPSV